MSRRRKRVKRIRLKKAWVPSIGSLLVLMAIFLYIAWSTALYLNRDKPSVYRVISDTRQNVINEKGIALRDETVFSSAHSGYINYYINSLSLTGKKDIIYSVDSTGNIYSNLTAEEKIKETDDTSLNSVFFRYHSSGDEFSALYQFKNSLKETAMMKSSRNVLTNLKNVVENYGNNSYFHVNYAPESGIVVFGIDGMEGLKAKNIDKKIFEETDQYSISFPPENSSKIEEGTPVYKLVKQGEWQVVVPVSANQALRLQELQYVNVTIDASDFKAKAKVETFEKEGDYFAILTFYNYMVNFADKRFLHISITLDRITGLKIAKSSVIDKKFYLIPSDFLISKDERYVEKGINLLTYDKKGNPTVQYLVKTVYYEANGFSYIEADEDFSAGDRITKIKPDNVKNVDDSEYFFTISKSDTLTGVFNVNKGYPEFRRIEVISDIDNDYLLVSDQTEFGLSDYDNIVLNASVLEGKKHE